MPAYHKATEVRDVAEAIIKQDRTYLNDTKIYYLFRPEAAISDNHAVAGMAVRVDDRNRTIHDYDFIVEIAKDIWESLDATFRKALVDHELGHIGLRKDKEGNVIFCTDTGRPRTFSKKHDLEEFSEVLERHGAYHERIRDFLDAYARNKATTAHESAQGTSQS